MRLFFFVLVAVLCCLTTIGFTEDGLRYSTPELEESITDTLLALFGNEDARPYVNWTYDRKIRHPQWSTIIDTFTVKKSEAELQQIITVINRNSFSPVATVVRSYLIEYFIYKQQFDLADNLVEQGLAYVIPYLKYTTSEEINRLEREENKDLAVIRGKYYFDLFRFKKGTILLRTGYYEDAYQIFSTVLSDQENSRRPYGMYLTNDEYNKWLIPYCNRRRDEGTLIGWYLEPEDDKFIYMLLDLDFYVDMVGEYYLGKGGTYEK